jgi:hypothetical protein
MTYGSLIVETRPIENMSTIIGNHTKHLPSDWGLMVICSPDNQHLVPVNAKKVVLPSAFMNEYEYNKLLTSFWFWQQIPFDKVLLFQHDSEIFRQWDSRFEQWDYIGAPWSFQSHGGNGGLSWRSVAAMKWCLQQRVWNPTMGNEDIFFCNILNGSEEYKLAPRMVCSEFSCEAIYQPDPFGAHAIDKWLTPEQCTKLRTQNND